MILDVKEKEVRAVYSQWSLFNLKSPKSNALEGMQQEISSSESCWSGKLEPGVMHSENGKTFILIIYLQNGDWILGDVVDYH